MVPLFFSCWRSRAGAGLQSPSANQDVSGRAERAFDPFRDHLMEVQFLFALDEHVADLLSFRVRLTHDVEHVR